MERSEANLTSRHAAVRTPDSGEDGDAESPFEQLEIEYFRMQAVEERDDDDRGA
jgi:hypothetical protein